MKEFLSREGVSYQEKNVAQDQRAAQEMVQRTGQMGVPVTIIADQAIVGFNQPALKQAVTRLRQTKNAAPAIKLGAQVADAARILAQRGQPAQAGAMLGRVQADGLAAKAGLLEDDVIVAVEGQPVTNADGLAKILQTLAANKITRPRFKVWRNGAFHELQA